MARAAAPATARNEVLMARVVNCESGSRGMMNVPVVEDSSRRCSGSGSGGGAVREWKVSSTSERRDSETNLAAVPVAVSPEETIEVMAELAELTADEAEETADETRGEVLREKMQSGKPPSRVETVKCT